MDKSCHSNSAEISRLSNNVQRLDETIDNDVRTASVEEFLNLGLSYQVHGQNQEPVESYERAIQIAIETGDNGSKAKAYQHLRIIYTAISEYKNANEYYQDTINIIRNLEDEEMKLGGLYLILASVCCKDCDYGKAIECYQKALTISEAEPTDHLLREKALTGLAIALFNLGHNKEAMESIYAAQEDFKMEAKTGNHYYNK